MKARDYLIPLGLAKAGRGRLSRAAKEELDKAIAKGQRFSDYPSGSTVAKSKSSKSKQGKIAAGKSEAAAVTDDYPKQDWYHTGHFWPPYTMFRDSVTGKEVNGASVCVRCGYSLTVCTCMPYPATLVDHEERIIVRS